MVCVVLKYLLRLKVYVSGFWDLYYMYIDYKIIDYVLL